MDAYYTILKGELERGYRGQYSGKDVNSFGTIIGYNKTRFQKLRNLGFKYVYEAIYNNFSMSNAMEYSASGVEGGLVRIDWEDHIAVYHGTKEWARAINQGSKPIGTKLWNVNDIYSNIEPEWWRGWAMNGAIHRGYTYKSGLQIRITETRLENYRQNYIGGITADKELLRIYFVSPYEPVKNVISISFSNEALFNEWYNYIF
ncbi:MAG: hypothetical protein CVU09_07430 [Bacteroidetes bacterium HGW-Bacteroidetes-4]|jgi:hypothetical protein|nr:MAG: hypothetical protein CVU09_07430 [Bacteroidetes bacterium HGW-Bacteroidetes-4]